MAAADRCDDDVAGDDADDDALSDELFDDILQAEPLKPEKTPTCDLNGRWHVLGQGIVHWPIEIRRSIAGYLPWREVVLTSTKLCSTWRCFGKDIPLWWVFFEATWPIHAERQARRNSGPQDWRIMFRTRWLRGDRDGDATAEDWLDFYAAHKAATGKEAAEKAKVAARGQASRESRQMKELEVCLQKCRESVLDEFGVTVPAQADLRHLCDRYCRFHALPALKCSFLCETSGNIHRCRKDAPCDMCMVSADGCYLVCPASGCTYERLNFIHEEPPEEPDVWDPDMSENQQIARWIEHGYGMSEEQAKNYFN